MIFGLEPKAKLPENCTPVEAVAVVKYLGEDGEVYTHLTSTAGLNAFECLGLFEAAAYTTKRDIHAAFEPEDDEDELG